MVAKKRLGELLLQQQHIGEDELNAALETQSRLSQRLGEVLFSRGLVAKADLIASLEEVTGIQYVDCLAAEVQAEALKLVPSDFAWRHLVLPLALDGKKLVAALAEPQDLRALDELRFRSGMEVSPRWGFKREIEEALEKWYGGRPADAAQPEKPADSSGGAVEPTEVLFFTASASERNRAAMLEFQAEQRQQRTPAVSLVSSIIAAAAAQKASDIHIEPQAVGARVRFRIDGILKEIAQVPVGLQNALISRLKILADMDIAERRMPQDGRFMVEIGSRRLDLRVSSLPTHHGLEKIVIRLLDPAATRVGFGDLGFSSEQIETLAHALRQPQGTILVTGPTGSGKSTTLYAALNYLRSPAVNIVTIEDPVEYYLEGINQVQVHNKAGLTFAACLRSLMRQDPNVIMIGEIRDGETAEMALRAAQTGHLLLSTLHTNDSVSAVGRLLDLGVPSFLVASSLSAVVAQRLVRRLCACRRPNPLSPETYELLLGTELVNRERKRTAEPAQRRNPGSIVQPLAGEFVWVPAGCPACDGAGYKGRLAIYEVLVFGEQLRACVQAGGSVEEIRALARGSGMRAMGDDAFDKVRQGLTSLEELMRAVPLESAQASDCPGCGHPLSAAFVFCPYCGLRRLSEPDAGARPHPLAFSSVEGA